jgi:UDP-glucose 4-epimerase
VDLLATPFTDVVGSIVDRRVVERAMDGVDQVIHTATLHKPHVSSHSRQDFIDTNLTGTLNLLEASVSRVRAFLFTSTTSTFGDALVPPPGEPAAWITEDVVPVPKNIYGVTKVAAEDLCALAFRNQGLPCLVLRTSRFFPEADDDPEARNAYTDANLKVTEYLYRRVDIDDVVSAHLCALERAPAIGFARYIISATPPFTRDDLAELRSDSPAVVTRRVPQWRDVYARHGWRMRPSIDRVYANAKARRELGWEPRCDFAAILERVRDSGDPRSELARAVGIKGYHSHAHGVYTV